MCRWTVAEMALMLGRNRIRPNELRDEEIEKLAAHYGRNWKKVIDEIFQTRNRAG